MKSLRALCMLSALFVLVTSVASAQSGPPSNPQLQLEYVPTMQSIEELQREYDSIRLWGPALGVPTSYFAAGGGMAMIVSANLDFCFYPPCVEEPHTRSERALIASGSIFIAAGVAGFIASIVRIAQKRERKRRLRFEMAQLRFGRHPASSLSRAANKPQGSHGTRF
jgi:hypothetical protein